MSWQTDDAADAWWGQALADFSRGLGFENFTGGDSSVHNFIIGDNKYLLDIEFSAEDIALAIFREVPTQLVEAKTLSLLQQCNFDKYLPFLVQVGLKDNNILVLMVRLEKSHADQMMQAFELMCKLYADAKL